MKHFNAGNVWGTVQEVKKGQNQNGKPFLMLNIDCIGSCGNVYVYGRLWTETLIDPFLEVYKKNPQTQFHFRGFFSQYLSKKDNSCMYNYSFFKWNISTPTLPRAAFVLCGEVVGKEERGSKGLLQIKVTKEGRQGYKATTETFDLWAGDYKSIQDFKQGDVWKVKGCLSQGQEMDFFGDSPDNPILPYIMAVESCS